MLTTIPSQVLARRRARFVASTRSPEDTWTRVQTTLTPIVGIVQATGDRPLEQSVHV